MTSICLAIRFKPILILVIFFFLASCLAKSNQKNILEDISDIKDFKKLLRTKTNILVLFVSNSKNAVNEIKVFEEAAKAVRGFGTMLLEDCSLPDRKKLCKKLKVTPEPFILKHYKDGDYHKDYDRQLNVASMITFMRDPTGDLPWNEDPEGADVVHFANYNLFTRHLRKDTRPMLVMFYVPWCGYCKRLKPDYSKAASELKGQNYVLAAMDVEQSENIAARKAYNITGFPTMLYFENGRVKHSYEGEHNKAALVSFMKNPNAAPTKKPKETEWAEDTNSEIVYLSTQGFDPAIKDEKSVLIMFYAPWCGHCKHMKPEFEKAAVLLKERKIPGILAAVDATKETEIGERFKVKGYPTVKYFVNGVFKFDVNVREAEKIVEFMRNPKEPPPPPPPEKLWEEEEGAADVLFLNEENFKSTLKRKKHVLVMFYAPWCGHCKNTKPEFVAAAKSLREDGRIAFVAVDCTRHTSLCAAYEVRGYPTLKYFSYFNKIQKDYAGGRSRKDFIDFMTDPVTNAFEKRDEL